MRGKIYLVGLVFFVETLISGKVSLSDGKLRVGIFVDARSVAVREITRTLEEKAVQV